MEWIIEVKDFNSEEWEYAESIEGDQGAAERVAQDWADDYADTRIGPESAGPEEWLYYRDGEWVDAKHA